jgi:hypothetical protein
MALGFNSKLNKWLVFQVQVFSKKPVIEDRLFDLRRRLLFRRRLDYRILPELTAPLNLLDRRWTHAGCFLKGWRRNLGWRYLCPPTS